MTRRPERDEPLALDLGAATRGGRVYLRELAAYLHHKVRELRVFANNQGILYWQGRGAGRSSVPYVSEQGAMRIIAHVRAIQGAEYLEGKPFHELRLAAAAQMARSNARKREILKQENQALEAKSRLLLAIPRAGTEDESRGGT